MFGFFSKVAAYDKLSQFAKSQTLNLDSKLKRLYPPGDEYGATLYISSIITLEITRSTSTSKAWKFCKIYFKDFADEINSSPMASLSPFGAFSLEKMHDDFEHIFKEYAHALTVVGTDNYQLEDISKMVLLNSGIKAPESVYSEEYKDYTHVIKEIKDITITTGRTAFLMAKDL